MIPKSRKRPRPCGVTNTLPACMSPWNRPWTTAPSIHARMPVRRMSSRSWPAGFQHVAVVHRHALDEGHHEHTLPHHPVDRVRSKTRARVVAAAGRGWPRTSPCPPASRREVELLTHRDGQVLDDGGGVRDLAQCPSPFESTKARSEQKFQVALNSTTQARAADLHHDVGAVEEPRPVDLGDRRRRERLERRSRRRGGRAAAPELPLDDPDHARRRLRRHVVEQAPHLGGQPRRGTGRGSTP